MIDTPLISAPRLYPTEVAVHSINGENIRVTFRGVSTGLGEEPLLGYKVFQQC